MAGTPPNTDNANPPAIRSTTLRRDLRLLNADAFAWAVMTGCGEAYFVAFGLASGLGEVASGLLATVPLLIGAAVQMVSPWGIRRCGSLRTWIASNAGIQALSLLPLVVMAEVETVPAWAIFTLASIYWAAGLATAPAWNTWVTTLVPRTMRARFFAMRSRLAQVGLIVGLAIAAGLLQWGRGGGFELQAFGLVFLVAFLARLVSSVLLYRHSDAPSGFIDRIEPISRRALAPFLAEGKGRLVLLYMLAVTMSVQVSGPFFTAYILEHLRFSYLELMGINACTVLSKVAFLPLIGRFAKEQGPGRLLWIGGLAITPAATLWLVSENFWYLLALQLAVGVGWACWEMATFLLVFDTIPESHRTPVLTLFNLANALAIVGGSVIGAVILRFTGVGAWGYAVLFGATGAMRLVTLFMLAAIAPIGLRERFKGRLLGLRTISVRPGASSIDLPLVEGEDAFEELDESEPASQREAADASEKRPPS
jgi:MFS family permease